MASYNDMKIVVEAAKEEISDKKLDKYYGSPYYTHVAKLYGEEGKSEIMIFAEYLLKSHEPKYYKLGEYLLGMKKEVNVGLEKTRVILSAKDKDDVDVKTTYREFKEIEKRRNKAAKFNFRKINKHKHLKNFIDYNLEDVLRLLSQQEQLQGELGSVAITQILDSCEELNFLDKSKFGKKYR